MLLPLFEDSCDMRTRRKPLGHKDVQTTPNYTHLLNRGDRGVHAPSTGSGSVSAARPLGLCRPAGQHKTVEETRGMERKWLHGKRLPRAARK